jgi:hypothetical protein
LDGHPDAGETVATHARNDCFEAKSQAATTDRPVLAALGLFIDVLGSTS